MILIPVGNMVTGYPFLDSLPPGPLPRNPARKNGRPLRAARDIGNGSGDPVDQKSMSPMPPGMPPPGAPSFFSSLISRGRYGDPAALRIALIKGSVSVAHTRERRPLLTLRAYPTAGRVSLYANDSQPKPLGLELRCGRDHHRDTLRRSPGRDPYTL